MRFLVLALLFATTGLRGADGPGIDFTALAVPLSAGPASGPSPTVGPDGTVWLTWQETAGGSTSLRLATLAPGARAWSPARTIARGTNWSVKASDFPRLAVAGPGQATVLWYVNNPGPPPAPSTPGQAHDHGAGYHALVSQTSDHGQTWSRPARLTRESDYVEFAALAALADGRVLATWLDGRAKHRGGTAQQLYSRLIGAKGPDVRIDPSVCDCCHTALTAFPDGTALLAYRGRSRDEVRDIRVARFRAGAWDEARPLHADDWKIPGCPVNGPQLASDGGRVAAAWFTGADNDPRVLATFSPDAGARFLMPLRLSEGKTAGRVSTLLLHDGAMLVTHADLDGALWLRRVTPDFAPSAPVKLTTPAEGRVKGFPRMALVRDYHGGKTPAQAIVAFASEIEPLVRTLLVTIPEADLLEAEKNCDCSPSAEDLQGFPIRGTIIDPRPAAGTIRVQHFEVPGIHAEGEREFRVDAASLPANPEPGRQFLARIEKRGDAWWLFNIRFIAMAPR